MKNILLPFLCLFFLQVKATVWTVNVTSNQFTPQTLNVVVGDKIHWVLASGSHSTTSLTVPAGAGSWDSGAPFATFDYTVAVAGSYSYFCTVHGFATMHASFTATSPLPVTLSTFDISTRDNKPLISWSTATENNTDYFSIRKSTNGISFNEIGKVKATGTSSVVKQYSFTDNNLPRETKYVYYELAIVDKDGRSQLFPIKIYQNKNAVSKLIIALSPNPISGMGHLMLQFNADKQGIMKVKVIDSQGRTVLTNDLSATQGINNGHVHLGNLPPGSYTINFSLEGINESYKITKN